MTRAKFQVECIKMFAAGNEVRLIPVTSGSPENESFFKWTPGGEVRLTILNPAALEMFKVGSQYYLDFTEAT